MSKEVAAQFDELAALYEDMASWPFRRDIETPSVVAALGDVRGLDVLDFGCGSGLYSRLLKRSGARSVVGYDLADGMLGYARRRAEKEGLDIEFVSELQPRFAGRFDVVLSVYVLPYATSVGELGQMCGELAGLLRPGGRLVALPIHPDYQPDPDYYQSYGFRLVPDDDNDRPARSDGARIRLELCHGRYQASVHAWYWSRAALEAALREAGMTDLVWRDPSTAADPAAAAPLLRAYLDRPHAALILARKA